MGIRSYRPRAALVLDMGDNPPHTAKLRIAAPLELLEDNPRGVLPGVEDVQLRMTPDEYYVDVRFHGSFVQVQYPNGVAEEAEK